VLFIVNTKSLDQTLNNYKSGIGKAPANYKAGVMRATNTIENAIAAEPLYAAKVQEAVTSGSRVKGLQKTSTAEWKQRASELGSARIGPGMNAALPKYQKGMGEVLSTIQGVSIGERTADPMANVDARVKPIVKALYDMKRK